MSETAKPRTLRGEDILTWIRQPGMTPFRYRLNAGGVVFFLLLALATGLGAGAYWKLHAAERGALFATAIIGSFAVWFVWVALHWLIFTARTYLGITERELMVGRGAQAVVIPLSRIDRGAIDAKRMRASAFTTVLPIRVDDVRVRIHIHGPFAVMKQHRQFVTAILSQLVEDLPAEDGEPGTDGAAP